MDNILFIINPVSGGKSKLYLEKYIPGFYSKMGKTVQVKIVFTQHRGHAREIAMDNIDRFDKIVAVGGDGTINEVASALVNTNVLFGIVPTGSGNGLARHLTIPMNINKALLLIANGKGKKIDSGKLDDHFFFCTCGVGFDARISHAFAKSKKRGFKSYVSTAIREYIRFSPEDYELELNGKRLTKKAFLITIANAAQYGNNFYIAPEAAVNDGLFDVVVVKPFPVFYVFILAHRMYHRSLSKSKYVEIYKSAEVKIRKVVSSEAHFDGEPVNCGNEIDIRINLGSLKVIMKN